MLCGCALAASVLIDNVVWPKPLRLCTTVCAPLSITNVTVPVGVGEPAATGLTVAVKLAVWPKNVARVSGVSDTLAWAPATVNGSVFWLAR